jgi:nitrous oxidase accessory protein NosD
VAGNTFDRNNRGVAFVNARNLRVEQNLFTRNRVAVVFVEGDNSGSSMAGNTFGTGALRNARIFQRVRGSQGI